MCPFQKKVRFLRHIISKNRSEADAGKVEAVQNFPKPQNQTDVQSSLGLGSNWRRFNKKIAPIARSLH